MSFDFASKDEGELFMSLKALVNHNNGFFKSLKQAQFLFQRYSESFNEFHTREQIKSHWGIEVAEDQITMSATAYTKWADYGTRSIVPVLFVFVMDKMGIVAHYKVGGTGNLRDGWSPNADKTKMLWSRDATVAAPFAYPTEAEIVAAKAAEPVSQHVGTVGEKISRQMMVKRMSAVVSMYGDSMRYVFADTDGNTFIYFGTSKVLNGVNEGDSVSLTFKVKAHNVYNGVNQTQISFR